MRYWQVLITYILFSGCHLSSIHKSSVTEKIINIDNLPKVFISSIVNSDYKAFKSLIVDDSNIVYRLIDNSGSFFNKKQIKEQADSLYSFFNKKRITTDVLFEKLCKLSKERWDTINPIYDYIITINQSSSISIASIKFWINSKETGVTDLSLPFCIKIDNEWKILPFVYQYFNPDFDPKFEIELRDLLLNPLGSKVDKYGLDHICPK